MSTNLQIFEFESQTVRTVELDGVVWFVAKDVAAILGYVEPHKAIQRHCKNFVALSDLKKQWDGSSHCNEINELHPRSLMIQESDVFRLIINSRLPSAEKFERWVMEDVMPAIRKTGYYSTQPKSSLEVLQLAINALVEQERRTALLEAEQKSLATRQQVIEDRVALLDSGTGYMSVRGFCKVHHLPCPLHLAKQYGKALSKICRDRGLPIGQVVDEAFGTVGSYPVELIAEYFGLGE